MNHHQHWVTETVGISMRHLRVRECDAVDTLVACGHTVTPPASDAPLDLVALNDPDTWCFLTNLGYTIRPTRSGEEPTGSYRRDTRWSPVTA